MIMGILTTTTKKKLWADWVFRVTKKKKKKKKKKPGRLLVIYGHIGN
jgi:hypothetical protein